MDNSILTEIKKLLGLDESYKAFDTDIIIHINTALMILTDIGIGPEDGYYIVDGTETWNDYLGVDMGKYQSDVDLTSDEVASIVAFLNSLTGEINGKPITTSNSRDEIHGH